MPSESPPIDKAQRSNEPENSFERGAFQNLGNFGHLAVTWRLAADGNGG